MKNESLVSIIVPVFNVEKYLPECIDSILGQTYQRFELLLIDDGSTDSSGKICDQYSDSRITTIHQENQGLSAARNSGIQMASGEYLIFVDSDDYLPGIALEKMMDAVKKYSVPLVIGSHIQVDENGKTLFESNLMTEEVLSGIDILRGKKTVSDMAQAKLYDKRLFDSVSFPKGKIHEDSFIFHKIILQCSRVACISDIVYYYRIRNNSIMTSTWSIRRLDGMEAMLKRSRCFHDYNIPESTIPALKTIGRGIVIFSDYYRKRNWRVDGQHRCRNRELQQLFREAAMPQLKKAPLGWKCKILIYSTDIFGAAWITDHIKNIWHKSVKHKTGN